MAEALSSKNARKFLLIIPRCLARWTEPDNTNLTARVTETGPRLSGERQRDRCSRGLNGSVRRSNLWVANIEVGDSLVGHASRLLRSFPATRRGGRLASDCLKALDALD